MVSSTCAGTPKQLDALAVCYAEQAPYTAGRASAGSWVDPAAV